LVKWGKFWRAFGRNPFRGLGSLELGPAWAGNSVNCVPFRMDAVVTRGTERFATYFDEAGDVSVIRQDLAQGAVERATIPNARKPYDAHQCISMGIDPTGRIHLAFGAHAEPLLVTQSRTSRLADGFDPPRERFDRATYPMFVTLADGTLAFLYRLGRHNAGSIMVEHLDAGGAGWVPRPGPLLSGLEGPSTSGPYLNTPVVADDGSIYLFVVWRLDTRDRPRFGIVNSGIDCVASRDGLRSLATIGGMPLPETVTPADAERVVAVPLDANLINQASAALLGKASPAFLTYWAGSDGIPQYRFGWRAQDGWRAVPASRFKTTFDLRGSGTLPLPHSRPELLVCRDKRAIVLWRSAECANRLMASILHPPRYSLAWASHQVLVDEDLGFYEPIVDRSAWRARQELTLYVQHCQQGRGRDRRRDIAAAPARLMSWVLA
jgi:hypothetical protein